MREIVLDTETTGLSPAEGHKVVEIGAVELVNHLPTGRVYHQYINPQRDMPGEAERIHGLSTAFLSDKPVFAKIAEEFVEFIGDAVLVIHNAAFDVGFLNAELKAVGLAPIMQDRVVDSLAIAKRKNPMGSNSLDALCKRFGIDNSMREKHGALLDSELLAEVYLELIGGRQTSMALKSGAVAASENSENKPRQTTLKRPVELPSRLSEEEMTAHEAFVEDLGEAALWRKI